ncbi:MAG: helix-turn-helix transcriptional regulator [Roseobacter sp.]
MIGWSRRSFFNGFLKQDGLCFGINDFAYDRGLNIGDMRIWHGGKKEDFSERALLIVNAIGPSFVNLLIRAQKNDSDAPALRFASIGDRVQLTARESEVVDLLVLGASDDEICAKLLISKSTLRSHITSIFQKTGLNRRTQLAQFLTDNSGF